jgi:uncharacterized protein (DUF2141 family)
MPAQIIAAVSSIAAIWMLLMGAQPALAQPVLAQLAHVAAVDQNGTSLSVGVVHPVTPDADVRVGLYTSSENWLDDNPVFGALAATTDTLTTVTFEDLPAGTYGAAIYLDENRNGKLDRNLIGLFKESFGFSERARARFGPPKWKDAVFEVVGDSVTIQVRLN